MAGPPVAAAAQLAQSLYAAADAAALFQNRLDAALAPLVATQAQTTAALATLQATQAQTTAALAQTTAALATLHASVMRLEVRSALTYNTTCGNGIDRAYVPVPNAAGVVAPVGYALLQNLPALHALSGPQLATWCGHYGLLQTGSLSLRRHRVAGALGLSVSAEQMPPAV